MNKRKMIITICLIALGCLSGSLWEKWKYYNKTGKHLQDMNECNHNWYEWSKDDTTAVSGDHYHRFCVNCFKKQSNSHIND